MGKFAKLLGKISVLEKLCILILTVLLVLLWICSLSLKHRVGKLSDQKAYLRWDKEGGCGQISLFFGREDAVDAFAVKEFEYHLQEGLKAASFLPEEKERIYIDTASARGRIDVQHDRGKLEKADAIGILGDFFYFHPLELMSGRYFSGEELMQDHILLDEEAAWSLFGSSDIEGMNVMIGDTPYIITGVFRKPEKRFAPDLGGPLIIMSYEALAERDPECFINCYEFIAPNPVRGFLTNMVKKDFGLNEDKLEIIDHAERFHFRNLWDVLLSLDSRSIRTYAIAYPFWENIARVYLDKCAVLLAFWCLYLTFLTAFILLMIGKMLKGRGRNV